MTFLLDTDTCVYWLRGQDPVRSRLSQVGPENAAISIITLAELRYGASWSARPDENNAAIDDFISGIAVLGLDCDVACAFGEVKAELRRTGVLIADFDLLIGVTARTHAMTLVTNNVDHFRRINGLKLANWVKP